ncbi:MAG: DNA-binding transcriptional MerR regulator [Desulforhopalus sp.]|jgi:DNA-binding transcriptional MerR regulator
MNISEFSQHTGISAHTIRYYEKAGIIRNINRNASGHRNFTKDDLIWADFIHRLKETGMSLANIKEYADMREEGSITSESRMKLLQKHVEILEDKIETHSLHLKKLHEKIKLYETQINGEKFNLT